MKSRESQRQIEAADPRRAGARPQILLCGLLVASLAPFVGLACANSSADVVEPPVVLGMTSSVPYYYSDANLTMYEVQTPVPLPVRKPTSAESAALGKAVPYPHAPFLLASDLQVEIRYTISNLDNQPHNVELLLDPWNEFVRYAPGVTVVDDDDTEPNLSGYDNFLIVPALSRLQGTITTDDTTNLETDLDMAMDVMANPPGMNSGYDATTLLNHIFDIQNRSNDGDPLTTPYIPQVIAGITGFDLGLRTYETANISVEIVVDATDLNGDRFVGEGTSNTPMGRPGNTLSPPGALQGD